MNISKALLILNTISVCLISCEPSIEKNRRNESENKINIQAEVQTELTIDQESAFDALNMIQISTKEKNRFYSTFPGIEHSCSPEDTTIHISQSDLKSAIVQYLRENGKYLSIEKQEDLSSKAVLAQEEYQIRHCSGNISPQEYKNGIPKEGKWILPNILERRDLIIKW